MSDLFHERVSDRFIEDVFAVMGDASKHTFQVLTKRAERLASLQRQLRWAPNIWMGVSDGTRVNTLAVANSKNAILYHLVFASKHPRGSKISIRRHDGEQRGFGF